MLTVPFCIVISRMYLTLCKLRVFRLVTDILMFLRNSSFQNSRLCAVFGKLHCAPSPHNVQQVTHYSFQHVYLKFDKVYYSSISVGQCLSGLEFNRFLHEVHMWRVCKDECRD